MRAPDSTRAGVTVLSTKLPPRPKERTTKVGADEALAEASSRWAWSSVDRLTAGPEVYTAFDWQRRGACRVSTWGF